MRCLAHCGHCIVARMETAQRCTEKVILRLPPLLRDRLQSKATAERRSLSNYLVCLIEQADERSRTSAGVTYDALKQQEGGSDR